MSKRPGSPLTPTFGPASPRPKKARIGDLIVDGNFRPASVVSVEDGEEEESVPAAAEEEGEEEEVAPEKGWREGPPEGYSDLYLDTINR